MKKRLLSAFLALGLMVSPVLTVSAADFSDVAADAWYAGAVEAVSESGLMLGTSDLHFSPDGSVTRGMAITVLWRLAGSPEPDSESSFPDVVNSSYYAKSASWAEENGIVAGLDSGLFAGDLAVTREQLAVFLYRYAKFAGQELATGVLDRFSDKDSVHDWALDGMSHAVGIGLITGNDDGRLDPGGQATRAQLAVILQRLLTPAVG